MTSAAGTWVVAGLEVAAAHGIAVFWVPWFRDGHDEEWLPEGYVQHERVFVFPDLVLALLLVASAILPVTGRPLGRSPSLSWCVSSSDRSALGSGRQCGFGR